MPVSGETPDNQNTSKDIQSMPLRDMANAIRALSMDAVEAAKSGHPGLPMGAADLATVLYTKFLKIDPLAPDWPDRDRFVISASSARARPGILNTATPQVSKPPQARSGRAFRPPLVWRLASA